MKILIIGAVAGGASAAARARRLDEDADIILVERGEAPSFANCGLPYYVGGVIESRDKLLVTPQQRLIDRYRLDVRTHTEALRIDRQAKTVLLRDLQTGDEHRESYDKLILSPGASPLRPPIPGVDLPQVYTLRDLGDADRLSRAACPSRTSRRDWSRVYRPGNDREPRSIAALRPRWSSWPIKYFLPGTPRWSAASPPTCAARESN